MSRQPLLRRLRADAARRAGFVLLALSFTVVAGSDLLGQHHCAHHDPGAVSVETGDVSASAHGHHDADGGSIINSSLTWRPGGAGGAVLAVEWSHLGGYWVNAQNTKRYEGHDLLKLRANVPLSEHVTLFGKLNNLTDERYAENAGWSAFRGTELAPGMPRTVYVGAHLTWRGI